MNATQENAQMVSLDELFDFIDCCVCPDVFTDSLDVNDPRCEHAMLPALEFPMDKTKNSPTITDQTSRDLKISKPKLTTKPKRKRIRTGWSSSTGLQRRKRAELQFLREHVRDLEAYAEKLKKRVSLVQESDKRSCNWQEMAAVEFTERQKAEETNRTLKRMMDSQMQVSAALHMIAQQNAVV